MVLHLIHTSNQKKYCFFLFKCCHLFNWTKWFSNRQTAAIYIEMKICTHIIWHGIFRFIYRPSVFAWFDMKNMYEIAIVMLNHKIYAELWRPLFFFSGFFFPFSRSNTHFLRTRWNSSVRPKKTLKAFFFLRVNSKQMTLNDGNLVCFTLVFKIEKQMQEIDHHVVSACEGEIKFT